MRRGTWFDADEGIGRRRVLRFRILAAFDSVLRGFVAQGTPRTSLHNGDRGMRRGRGRK